MTGTIKKIRGIQGEERKRNASPGADEDKKTVFSCGLKLIFKFWGKKIFSLTSLVNNIDV